MQDFIGRVMRCELRLADESLPMWKRVSEALAVWKGLEMGPLPPKLRKHIKARIAAINDILTRYPIKSAEDYSLIPPDDLSAIATELRKIL